MTLMTSAQKNLASPFLTNVPANAINAISQFVSGLRPVQIVATLPGGATEGDFCVLTTDGKLYRYHSGAWTKNIYAADLGDYVQAGQLAANSVTAGTIAAGAIDSMYITGAVVRTAASGARIVMGSNALIAYNAAEGVTYQLTPDSMYSGEVKANHYVIWDGANNWTVIDANRDASLNNITVAGTVDGVDVSAHAAASASVHGVSGDVMGTGSNQTMASGSGINGYTNGITISAGTLKCSTLEVGTFSSQPGASIAGYIGIHDVNGNYYKMAIVS